MLVKEPTKVKGKDQDVAQVVHKVEEIKTEAHVCSHL